jgi:S-DNA-T family DNA segregation ATPase FtsK/SpoIIIE
VAIGRLGRSLVLHLLLASQQQVQDEGRLRGLDTRLSSYRICLKTFSTHESRASSVCPMSIT